MTIKLRRKEGSVLKSCDPPQTDPFQIVHVEMSEMERAYRRRVEGARRGLFGLAFVCLTVSHFTFGPLFPPLIVGAWLSIALGAKGERILFPLAWRTFDAPKPSPTFEEEARVLAQALGVSIKGLRISPAASERPKARWTGRTLIATTALRDLPPSERRFALARILVYAPGFPELFGQYAGWPTFYAGFAAWQFGLPRLAWILAFLLAGWAILVVVRLCDRSQKASSQALAATGDEAGAAAFLVRERDAGSRRAARELAALGLLDSLRTGVGREG